jgi:hypothetical protein
LKSAIAVAIDLKATKQDQAAVVERRDLRFLARTHEIDVERRGSSPNPLERSVSARLQDH